MLEIKKYANGRFYNTRTKKYIKREEIYLLVRGGENVSIVYTKTGKNITREVLDQMPSAAEKHRREERAQTPPPRRERAAESEIPSSVLTQLLRKGGGTLADYARKYAALWQSAFNAAEDEVDKLVNRLVKDKELSASEGKKLKDDITKYAEDLRDWISDKIDQRTQEMLKKMNLASKDQIVSLTRQIESLTNKIDKLEKLQQKRSEMEQAANQ